MSSVQPIAILPEYIANSPTRVYLRQRLLSSSGHPLDVSYTNASTVGRPTHVFTTHKERGSSMSSSSLISFGSSSRRHHRITLYSATTGATVCSVENNSLGGRRSSAARWSVSLPGGWPAAHTEKRRGMGFGRGGLWVRVANAAVPAPAPVPGAWPSASAWRSAPEVLLEVREGWLLAPTEVFVAGSGVRVMSARKSAWHFRRDWAVDVAAGMDISLVSCVLHCASCP